VILVFGLKTLEIGFVLYFLPQRGIRRRQDYGGPSADGHRENLALF
jgi:hypothetical protein